MGSDYFPKEKQIQNRDNIGKISIIDNDNCSNIDNILMNQISNANIIQKGNSGEDFKSLLLNQLKDINTNLISLNSKDKVSDSEFKILKNLSKRFEHYNNNEIFYFDNTFEEMKYEFLKKKNKKFKSIIKNEVKNTLIKPILDALNDKDKEISEMKFQIENLNKYILENKNQMEKEFDKKIENVQNNNKCLLDQFKKHNVDMGNIINKYDDNFSKLLEEIKKINLNIKNLENKNQKEIENVKNKIPYEINVLKKEITSNMDKKEIENNSKFEDIIKLCKENTSEIKKNELEIKSLKKSIENCDSEQKLLKINDESKNKELKAMNEKINSNKAKLDNAIKEIEIINKNSKKNMISVANESFYKFNNLLQKQFALNKYKNQNELKLKLFSEKNYARVGLKNIGNNCYINSVLQILKNIPKFTYNFYLMDDNSGQFLLSFKKLLIKTCFSKDSSFSPREFKDNLGKENKKFSGDNQYDSTIFYISLLNIIQKKLYKPNNNIKLDMKKYENKSLEEKFKIWKDNYLSKNQTFIIDFFYTFYVSEIECNSCNHKTQSFQCTNFLDFPIISEKSEVESLEECFDNYQMIKTLYSDCSECNNKKLDQYFTILELPPILIINLKRVGERKAYFNDIKIPFQLDMGKIIKRTKINSIYELRGFIKHSGNENYGHNFAFCKNMFDDKWYEYNDACCIPIEGKPTMDQIFLLCYVKVGSDIQNVHYLKEIADSLNESNLFRHFKKY